MQSVALIDYGSGNLRSAEKALRRAAGERADIVGTTTRRLSPAPTASCCRASARLRPAWRICASVTGWLRP